MPPRRAGSPRARSTPCSSARTGCAANGDVIAVAGTYPLALAASAAGMPFLVCVADDRDRLAVADGAAAPIEDGRPGAVLAAAGTRVAPEGTPTRNPVQDRDARGAGHGDRHRARLARSPCGAGAVAGPAVAPEPPDAAAEAVG